MKYTGLFVRMGCWWGGGMVDRGAKIGLAKDRPKHAESLGGMGDDTFLDVDVSSF
jgi:hypothetical protein